MKIRFAFSMLFVLLLGVMLSGNAFAVKTVDYDDTSSRGYNPRNEGEVVSFIENGDFKHWTAGFPDKWTVRAESPAGWNVVGAHLARMDYAVVHDTADGRGINDALGIFIRNTGGKGPHYAYASNHLTKIQQSGHYWVTLHATAWANLDVNPQGSYNSVAWYAISPEADPAKVAESAWRELFPDARPCQNSVQRCNQLARMETVMVNTGDYLHLRAGHKWGFFNAWTVFGFDDISIVPAVGEKPAEAEDVNSFKHTGGTVRWDQDAPR